MTAVKVKGKRFELQKLDKLILENIPAGMNIRTKPHRFAENANLDGLLCLRHIQKDKALFSIGTLGGGNHFIEADKDEDGGKWLIIHSGSRHLGTEVAGYYQKEAYSQSPEEIPFELAYASKDLMEAYLHDMAIVQAFAEINRAAISDEIIRGMKLDVEDSFSSIHNYVDIEAKILRKGAVSSRQGERLIIPMNMRDGCLICIGKGNADWNYSAPHGAGRMMNRADAMQSFTVSQFKKEMKHVYSTTVGKETLDESPMAYKPVDSIVSQIQGTAEIVGRTVPVYNFKAGRGKA